MSDKEGSRDDSDSMIDENKHISARNSKLSSFRCDMLI